MAIQETSPFTRVNTSSSLTIQLNRINASYPLADRVTFNPESRLVVNFIGPPGSGKGTQAGFLGKELKIPHLSMGDIFRKHLRDVTDLGALIMHHIDRRGAAMVPEELTIGMVATAVTETACENGFMLDGFPRSKKQAITLSNVLLHGSDLHIVIYFDIEESVILQRLQTFRYICNSCGTQQGAHALKEGEAKEKLECKECHSTDVKPRAADQKVEELRNRIREFEANKKDILTVLMTKYKIHHLKLSGKEGPEAVFEMVTKIIYERLQEHAIRNKTIPLEMTG